MWVENYEVPQWCKWNAAGNVCMTGKRSVGIRHAESGTNEKYLLAWRCRYLVWQYVFKSTDYPHTSYFYWSAKGSRRCSMQLGASLAWCAPTPIQSMWTLALLLSSGLDILMWLSAWLCMPLVGIWLKLIMVSRLVPKSWQLPVCWGIGWAQLVSLMGRLKNRTTGI